MELSSVTTLLIMQCQHGAGLLFQLADAPSRWNYHRLQPCLLMQCQHGAGLLFSWPMHHLDGIIIGYNPAHHAMSSWCRFTFSVG